MENLKSLRDMVNNFDKYSTDTAILERIEKSDKFNEITYSKLKQDIFALGTSLYYNKHVKGQKIAVIGENSYRWLVSYLAVICGAGIIVPLDKQLPQVELINLIKRSNVKMLIYSNSKEDLINSVKSSLPKDIEYVAMNKNVNQIESISNLDELINSGNNMIRDGKDEYVNLKINPEVFSALIFTSGTSSDSKGVMLSNKNLISNVNSICESYKDLTRRTYMSFLPMHHTYEFTITYLCTLSTGGTVGISQGLRTLMDDFKKIKPECMCCVPLLVENIKKKLQRAINESKKDKLVDIVANSTKLLNLSKNIVRRQVFKKIHETFGGNLKYILCGAAPLEKSTIDYMDGLGFIILQGYGLTEASPLVSGTTPKNIASGTVGKAINEVEVRVDITDKEENIGEIIVKGNNVMLGYFEDEAETKKVLKKGWLYTGDLGKFDKKGNLVITGRCKNVIVANNGKNIYPEEIERKINNIPLVEESMVYANSDKNKKTFLTARVTIDEKYILDKYGENRPSKEEISDMIWQYIIKINNELVAYKHIKNLEIKDKEFIKTSTMKIKRNKELEEK